MGATYNGHMNRNNNPQQSKARSITKLYRALASGVIVENEVKTVLCFVFLHISTVSILFSFSLAYSENSQFKTNNHHND